MNIAWLALPLRRVGTSDDMDAYLYVFLHHGVYMIGTPHLPLSFARHLNDD
jgi:hypothetical protein